MNLSPVTADSVAITIVYTILLAWGFGVGVRQVWQGFHRPDELLNPLFRNRQAIKIFTFHLIVVSADLFVCGPLAVQYKSPLWYWGGRIALLSSSFPLAAYFNRNPQSFGKLIGYWVRFRNFFEISLHVLVAAMAVNWFYYYGLLWWLVAYRYLDVGPRRLFQTFYNTPAKLAARPWAPILNWVVITTIYVLTCLAIYHRKVIYAAPPLEGLAEHVPSTFEHVAVLAINVGVALTAWNMMKKYTGDATAEDAKHAPQGTAGTGTRAAGASSAK
jgi:predicted secreted protein